MLWSAVLEALPPPFHSLFPGVLSASLYPFWIIIIIAPNIIIIIIINKKDPGMFSLLGGAGEIDLFGAKATPDKKEETKKVRRNTTR